MLITISGVLVASKGYLASEDSVDLPSVAVSTPTLVPEDVAQVIPVDKLADIAAPELKWVRGSHILLIVIGTDVCGASLVEADDWAAQAEDYGSRTGTALVPIALTLAQSGAEAERYSALAELGFATLSSDDESLLASFGFTDERASRQLVLLVDTEDGTVLRTQYLYNSLTTLEFKEDLFGLAGS